MDVKRSQIKQPSTRSVPSSVGFHVVFDTNVSFPSEGSPFAPSGECSSRSVRSSILQHQRPFRHRPFLFASVETISCDRSDRVRIHLSRIAWERRKDAHGTWNDPKTWMETGRERIAMETVVGSTTDRIRPVADVDRQGKEGERQSERRLQGSPSLSYAFKIHSHPWSRCRWKGVSALGRLRNPGGREEQPAPVLGASGRGKGGEGRG